MNLRFGRTIVMVLCACTCFTSLALAATNTVLVYSTYVGGNASDRANAVAVDAAGYAIIVGDASSTNFPLTNAYRSAYGSWPAFVTKLTPDGTAAVFSTYLGGSDGFAEAQGVAVGTNGAIYVVGETLATNFPTEMPLQATIWPDGKADLFVSVFSPEGTNLIYSTYLGATSNDFADGIAVDAAGAAYVIGHTASTNFPTTNAYQATPPAGVSTIIAKLSPSGTNLIFSTYFGAANWTVPEGIAVDAAGAAYIAGQTTSTNLPLLNPIQSTYGGGSHDGFVAKFSPAGSNLVYSTYLGGSGLDYGMAIALDPSGAAYVGGYTYSSDFPTTNAYDDTRQAGFGQDGFFAKLSPAGTNLEFSSYLGGSSGDQVRGMGVDGEGSVFAAGLTGSDDFPSLNAIQPARDASTDAFLAKFDAAGSNITFSTYLGGSSADSATALAIDSSGHAYLAGQASSSDFPVTNAFQSAYGGGAGDAFVAKIGPDTNVYIQFEATASFGSESTTNIEIVVFMTPMTSGTATVQYSVSGGTASNGVDYLPSGTSLTFSPGETSKTISITVVDDTDIEMPETIIMTLSNPTNAMLGSPSTHTYTILDEDVPSCESPTLLYGTYLGGSGDDYGLNAASDAEGNVYISGRSTSTNFPILFPYDGTHNGGIDATITKLGVEATGIVYSTYLGGSADEIGFDIAVDDAGAAYVVGYTTSTNFPTMNAAQTTNGGSADAYVAKLSPTGTNLVYSTYYGGTNMEYGRGIDVDMSGAAYIIGMTQSTNLPTVNAYQPAAAGNDEMFITKMSPTGTNIIYASYLGGSGWEYGFDIAVDTTGAAYGVGHSSSADMPLTNAIQGAHAGGTQDAYVFKLDATGTNMVYATYVGGSAQDTCYGVDIDSDGAAYIVGQTLSTNFPTTSPYQAAYGGGASDAYYAKITSAGTNFAYSSYLGGTDADTAYDIWVDSFSSPVLAGFSDSSNFPTVNAVQPTYAGARDAIAARISADGTNLMWSTYIGGSGYEEASSVVLDHDSVAYVVGYTQSTNLPTQEPYQSSNAGGMDTFVTRIGCDTNQYIQFESNASTITEASTNITLAVHISPTNGGFVTVQYNVTGGTASNGVDYTVSGSSLTFNPGETSKTINVVVIDDDTVEPGETIEITLSNPTNALLQAPSSHTCTIQSSDAYELTYSTFLGGSAADVGVYSLDVDSQGQVVVAGDTSSADFPLKNAVVSNYTVNSVFITKFSADGTNLVYSTYLGGGNARSVLIDDADYTYVAGYSSGNLPATPGAYQTNYGGFSDGFVAKLVPDGTSLVFATYLGGSSSEVAFDVDLDSDGDFYAVGNTRSGDFPTTNSYDATYNGGDARGDVFVSKFSGDGSSLLYSTYLGWTNDESAYAIAVDSNEAMYVTGYTESTNFPTVNNIAGQPAGWVREENAFVLRLSPNGTNLEFSTYYGGIMRDEGRDIALDQVGNIYIAGYSGSVTPLNNPPELVADRGLYVAKLAPNATSVLFTAAFGGVYEEDGAGIALDNDGSIVVGGTYSVDSGIPLVHAVDAIPGGALSKEGIVAKLSPSGATLQFASYLGGSSSDWLSDIAVDSAGSIYVGGRTSSDDFPITNAYDGVRNNTDAFVAKIGPTLSVSFESSFSSGLESVTGVQFAVQLSKTSDVPITVAYAATGGTATTPDDYVLPSGTLTFSPGITQQFISLVIVDDLTAEYPETVEISLSNPTNSTLGSPMVHVYSIEANEPDMFDPDNDASSASVFPVGGEQLHTFHISSDIDWTRFYAVSNFTYTIRTFNVGINIDTVVDIYQEQPGGSLLNIGTVDDFGYGGSESTNLVAPPDGLYYVRVTPKTGGARPATKGKGTRGGGFESGSYGLSIHHNALSDTLIVIAYNEITRGPLPPSATITLDGGAPVVLNGKTWHTFFDTPVGSHTVQVSCGASGYVSLENPTNANQVANKHDIFYGNPRHLRIFTGELSVSNYAAFSFVPVVQPFALVRDAWTQARVYGAQIVFNAVEGHIVTNGHVVNGNPYYATYKSNWFTKADGTFPANVILPATNCHLLLTKGGYSNRAVANAITDVSAGDTPNLGTIYMIPLDENSNGLPDNWETDNFGGGTNVPPQDDPDGDGFNNTEELLLGTDPNDPNSYFRVEQVHGSNDAVTVIWSPAANGRSYKAEYNDDFSGTDWMHGGGPWETGTGQNNMEWSDTTATGMNGRCYRVRLAVP